jgi:hypothetical protein
MSQAFAAAAEDLVHSRQAGCEVLSDEEKATHIARTLTLFSNDTDGARFCGVCVCMCVWVYIYICVWMCVCVCVCMYVCVDVCMIFRSFSLDGG